MPAAAHLPLNVPGGVSPLGDARRGKFADNLAGFARALRRAGVPADATRIALAQEAAMLVGLARADFGAALEAVLVGREQDRLVFRELFDSYFRNPNVAQKLLAQMLPSAESRAEPAKRRPRVAEALAPVRAARAAAAREDDKVDFDAAMTASERERLKAADFNQLSASEYLLVQRLAQRVPLPLPRYAARRTQRGPRGARADWPLAMQRAARTGGELVQLPRLARQSQPLPLLVLLDVSGSMERYTRLLLAFLHAATAPGSGAGRRDVFAFGTLLTDLTPAFDHADPDAMLALASRAIPDFAGGTRLAAALAQLRQRHARRLVGRRTLVLLVSDGLDTGEPQALAQELAWLRRHCARLVWLNPLLRFGGYEPRARGAAELHRAADAMLAVHNLQSLQQLAASLAQVLHAPARAR
ncbi:hypothetical protein B2J88_19195 [Rhodococcus sp. SRB_17]|nr:hypothetical protein [Rhodococcus sp. SRB_17]